MRPLSAEHHFYSSPDMDPVSHECRKINHELSRKRSTSFMSDDDDEEESGGVSVV